MKKITTISATLVIVILGLYLLVFPEAVSSLYWNCNKVQKGMSYTDTKQLLARYQSSEYGFREFTSPDVSVDTRWIFFIPASYSCTIDFENNLVSDVDADLKFAGKFDF
jgi:hypothetical protein